MPTVYDTYRNKVLLSMFYGCMDRVLDGSRVSCVCMYACVGVVQHPSLFTAAAFQMRCYHWISSHRWMFDALAGVYR